MSQFADLLRAARRLDPKALTAIFDLFAPGLYKFVSRFVQDSDLADRIVNDEFVQLVEEFAAGRGPRAHLRCHLYQSTYRHLVDHLRETNPSAPLKLVLHPPSGEKRSLTHSHGQPGLETLLSAMNTELTDDQRLVIILRFLEDFSVKETAEILGKEISNIKVIQIRGFARLRKVMGMEPDEDPGNLLRL